jgi:ribonuclease HI
MEIVHLYTDGSVNPQSKIGCGAYLVVIDENSADESQVKLKRFDNTSSTKLELQVLLFALSEIKELNCKIVVHSDSQNIIGLLERRTKLETLSNKLLKNHELYRAFYKLIDQLDCEFHKVKGHKPGHKKDRIDALFTLVDRASRKELRTY